MLIGLSIAGGLGAQTDCCPYLDTIAIIPASPTTNDIINIITFSATPNLGYQISYDMTQEVDTFKLIGCFYNGMPTQPETYLDTTVIGTLEVGTYYVRYTGKQSETPMLCMAVDSNSISTSFQVIGASGFENITSDKDYFSIYPSPVSNVLSISGISPSDKPTIKITDAIGRHVMSEYNKQQLDVAHLRRGIYFIEVITEGSRAVLRFVKE